MVLLSIIVCLSALTLPVGIILLTYICGCRRPTTTETI